MTHVSDFQFKRSILPLVISALILEACTLCFGQSQPSPKVIIVPSFHVEFPLKGSRPDLDEALNPYSAVVNTVFDHSMKDGKQNYRIYGCDKTVEAYTGEVGSKTASSFQIQCRRGYSQDGKRTRFYVNGSYSGAGFLYYDGHPGIDYRAGLRTQVYAGTGGTIHYPRSIVGIRNGEAAYRVFHVMEIIPDGFPDYHIYYLHLLTHPDWKDQFGNPRFVQGFDPSPEPGCESSVLLPLPEGTHVNARCLVALSGNAGPSGTAPHLHFELQKKVPLSQLPIALQNDLRLRCIDDATRACLPVDPYGWDGDSEDPEQSLTGRTSGRLWVHQPTEL